MSQDAVRFVFMTCRAGAEAALKQEVANAEPEWRLSFSRPGFLTFKNGGERSIDDRRLAERHWTFAYTQGVSLGRIAGEQLAEMVQQFWAQPDIAAIATSGESVELHVWQRERVADEEDGLGTFATPLCVEIETALRAAAPEKTTLAREMGGRRKAAPRNCRVLDVVVVEPGEWWIGYHAAVKTTERWPGGAIPVRLPSHAVSRAYAKLEEAVQWSGLPLAVDDECVEVGCAPGGASQALLERGLFVTGIDPAEVDPVVLEHARFRHLKKRGSDVRRSEFEGVRWLVADMNIAPNDTLDEVDSIVRHPGLSIRGLVLTLKFSDWSVAEQLPKLVERVRGWGYRDVRCRQLVTGGQEICLVALRRKALRRLGRKRKAAGKPGQKRADEAHIEAPKPHF